MGELITEKATEIRSRIKKLNEEQNQHLQQLEKTYEHNQKLLEISENAGNIIYDIETQFSEATKFDSTDVAILFLATALQIGRWVLIAKLNEIAEEKISDSRKKDNDKTIKDKQKKSQQDYKNKHGDREHVKSDKYRDWAELVFGPVPYDTSIGSPKFGVNMEGGYHRVHTLGHDPVLGWIFGTMNIISDTITLDDFRTYKVSYNPKPPHWDYQTNLIDGFRMAIESIQEDSNRLPAALFSQAVHLQSDILTKKGLPIPVLETFSPELAGKLYKSGYDSLFLMKDIAVVGSQAVFAILINMIITLIHGLCYDPSKYESRDLFEVKTRKIILFSNVISSSLNFGWVAGNALAGVAAENPAAIKNALKDLDVGGLIVTMHRLITDTKFIREVKYQFLKNHWEMILSDEKISSMSDEEIYNMEAFKNE